VTAGVVLAMKKGKKDKSKKDKGKKVREAAEVVDEHPLGQEVVVGSGGWKKIKVSVTSGRVAGRAHETRFGRRSILLCMTTRSSEAWWTSRS
jgi:hypothetical protein